MAKSNWPPVPEMCFRPADSAFTWPNRSMSMALLMEMKLSIWLMTWTSLV